MDFFLGVQLHFTIDQLIKKLHIPAIKNSQISSKAKVCSGAHVVDVEMGDYSYIGNFSTVLFTHIGKYCSIADNCVIGGKAHPLSWVSTSPVGYNGKNCLKKNYSDLAFEDSALTIIENDVWIGNNTLIKAGVHISNGSVIGMGSVVTKNVGPYEIWAGNPARMIRKRFSDKLIDTMLISEWWNEDESIIKQYADLFDSPEEFSKKILMHKGKQ